MLNKPHPAIPVVLLALAMLALASCVVNNPTGPQVRGTPAADQVAGVLDLLATDTATPSPTATTPPTPTSTPTPLPTPTPVAALSVGGLPAGQVLFSTQRAGEPGEQLWLMSPQEGLNELVSDLLPGGWHCVAGEQVSCAFVTRYLGLFARRPLTGTTTLLDDLTPVRVTASMSVTPTLNVTGTETLSPTLAITGATGIEASVPVTAAFATTATAELAQGVTITATAGDASLPPVLAFSPGGQRLAVATQDHVAVYDLAEPALVALLQAGGPAELAWSPDGEQLALAYPASSGNAVALWSLADGRLRVLAEMEAAGRLAWAPDGSKLAFDARTSPETPSSQGGQPDVYILYLRSGEIANLTEVFLRNRGVDPSGQIGGWAPQWEPDSETVRYVRGVPGRIEEQNVVRQALRSRSPSVLWPAADAGTLGVVAEPAGAREARVIVRDGRDVVQVRQTGGDWQDATPGAFAGVASLAWGPDGVDGAPGLLLLADRQMLWIVDPASGSLSGLSVVCPDCTLTQAAWLP